MGPKGWTKPAPAAWLHAEVLTGSTAEEALQKWKSLSALKRGHIVERLKPSFPQSARIATEKSCMRLSQERLRFRKTHAIGCIRPMCPLAPSSDVLKVGDNVISNLHCLLEFDHRDAASKVNIVSKMSGLQRELEMQKTDCVCVWHHFLHTRHQMGHKGTHAPKFRYRADVVKWKERGCRHPLHASMPYAAIVPTPLEDPLAAGFYDISPTALACGSAHTLLGSLAELSTVDSLEEGFTTILCKFCRKLQMMCEKHKLHPNASLSSDQYKVLRIRHPAFVAHFEKSTAGVDWKSRETATRRKMSTSAQKRCAKQKAQSES
jgi:hypothetical protein